MEVVAGAPSFMLRMTETKARGRKKKPCGEQSPSSLQGEAGAPFPVPSWIQAWVYREALHYLFAFLYSTYLSPPPPKIGRRQIFTKPLLCVKYIISFLQNTPFYR